MAMTASELNGVLGGTLIGDGARVVDSCATLSNAQPNQVAFLHNPKYSKQLETTKAGVVILAVGQTRTIRREEGAAVLTAIEVKNPHYGWQQAVVTLHGFRKHPAVGISARAVIHPTAKVGKNANVHDFVVIGENAVVGGNANIYEGVTIMTGASVGDDCILYPKVTIYDACKVGNRCILHAGAVVGSDGYGFATHNGVHHKIPQTGIAVLEDDVELGANTVVERAVMEATVIGRGSKLGNGVVIGHNCVIGPGNLLVSQVGIAGSTTTGKYVAMGGQAGVAGHIHIPDMVRVAAQSGIIMEPEAGSEVGGTPAMEAGLARRVYLQLAQLPELVKRVRELERMAGKRSEQATRPGES